MTTGKHTVRDISCIKCQKVLGWKYVRSIVLSCLHILLTEEGIPFIRIEHTSPRSSTRRANISLSATCSWMCSNSREPFRRPTIRCLVRFSRNLGTHTWPTAQPPTASNPKPSELHIAQPAPIVCTFIDINIQVYILLTLLESVPVRITSSVELLWGKAGPSLVCPACT